MSLFETVISLIAPPECIGCGLEGSSLCDRCSGSRITPYGRRCWGCGALSQDGRSCRLCRRTGSPAYVWVTTNHQGLARELLHSFKFEQNRAAAGSIYRLMLETYLNSGKTRPDYLIMPVPTATSRVRERGFDHSALLAKKISMSLRLEYLSILGRLGQTRQVGSKRSDRLSQMADNFWVKSPQLVAGRQILLIDDVVTTGATINVASKALRQAGASRVDALIFAKRL